MENRTKLIISVFLFCIALFLFLFNLYRGGSILEERRIEASLNISNKQGFDLNGTKLTFGNLMPGTTSMRKVNLKNKYNFPVEIIIEVEGGIRKYLKFEERHFLNSNGSKEVGFVAEIPKEEKKGDYSGRILVTIRKK